MNPGHINGSFIARVSTDTDYGTAVRILICSAPVPGVRRFVVLPPALEAKTVEPGELVESPTFTFEMDLAQSLLDALWKIGIRPSEPQRDHGGELAATRFHLEDMRRLLFRVYDDRPSNGSVTPLRPAS